MRSLQCQLDDHDVAADVYLVQLAVTEDGKLSFDRDIKPLFRMKDRDAMQAAFDLFEYADVVENADAILGSLRSGQMPCDGAWPDADVEKLQQWIELGKPA